MRRERRLANWREVQRQGLRRRRLRRFLRARDLNAVKFGTSATLKVVYLIP